MPLSMAHISVFSTFRRDREHNLVSPSVNAWPGPDPGPVGHAREFESKMHSVQCIRWGAVNKINKRPSCTWLGWGGGGW